MDPISHLCWALTIFIFILGFGPVAIVLIVAILPDLPWIDFYLHKFKEAEKKHEKIISIFKSKKGQVMHYLHKHQPNYLRTMHFFMHSLFGWWLFSLIVVLFFRNYLFLSFVYLSHIIIDIPSHGRIRGPILFYPFSKISFNGIEFEEHNWMIIASYSLLILINIALFVPPI